MTMELFPTRRAVALALALVTIAAGAVTAQAQPAKYFSQANVQTHTTAVPFGNGAFSRSLVIDSTSYATNYQEFVDPVKDAFGNPRRFEVAYAASDLANGHLRAKAKGDLRVSGVNGGVIVLASSSIGDRFSIHRTPIFGAVPGDSVTFKLRVTAAATTVIAVPGTDPSLFFNSSALGLVIYKPGTLNANIPFGSSSAICEFFWGLGPGAKLGSFPLEDTLTTFPADIQATCDLSVGGYSDFDWALFLKPAVGTLSAGSSVDFDFSQSIDATFVVPENSTVTSASGFVPGVTAHTSSVFLRGTGATANPATLFLDGAPPIAAAPKTKDSGALKFAGGNPWKAIGTWQANPLVVEGEPAVIDFRALRVWLGLVNSDDQGAKVDLRVDVFRNDETSPAATGTLRCITGLTRDPNKAIEAVVDLITRGVLPFDGATDRVRVALSARMGTTESGTPCANSRASAVGVRAYFDGARRDARLEIVPTTGSTVIGTITGDIVRAIPAFQRPIGDVIADAFLAATTAAGAQIAFMNAGSIRDDLIFAEVTSGEAPGEVTFGEAFSVLPFGLDLVTMSLTGAQIMSVLEQQGLGANGSTSERPLQVSAGITYTWNRSLPIGSRVQNLSLNGTPIDPAATYRVTAPSFLANGGDFFAAMVAGTNRVVAPLVDVQALVAYLGAHSPLAPPTAVRVTVLN